MQQGLAPPCLETPRSQQQWRQRPRLPGSHHHLGRVICFCKVTAGLVRLMGMWQQMVVLLRVEMGQQKTPAGAARTLRQARRSRSSRAQARHHHQDEQQVVVVLGPLLQGLQQPH